MTSAERRAFEPLVRGVAGLTPSADPRVAALIAEADRLRARYFRATKAPEKRLGPSRASQKKAAKEERAERMARIREAVLARAGGSCEFCSRALSVAGCEVHHLESGSGTRRRREAVETCVAICVACHREIHARPAGMAGLVHGWATRHGLSVPRRFAAALGGPDAR